MPLSSKGSKILRAMIKTYGPKKGKKVFYASRNKGTIWGVDPETSMALPLTVSDGIQIVLAAGSYTYKTTDKGYLLTHQIGTFELAFESPKNWVAAGKTSAEQKSRMLEHQRIANHHAKAAIGEISDPSHDPHEHAAKAIAHHQAYKAISGGRHFFHPQFVNRLTGIRSSMKEAASARPKK